MLSTKIHGGSHVYYQCFSTPILVQLYMKVLASILITVQMDVVQFFMPPTHSQRSLEQTKYLDTVLLLNHPAGGTPN